ncbi:hypothetical protein KPH14_004134 [Odynerus spinipes]|uniref:Uncharacterized protein n=1 Tax=Odynerus spinipes TaxID=1348599 RepID=A0AAD9RY32_9HYME|nr:hypothetical protein KPH14_004134 [Odynerus spinipes]
MQNEETDPSVQSGESAVKYMSILPDFFNDTVGKSLKIENTKPQNMVEVLGKFLGIADYDRNLASFWFLDILALQVLRSNDLLDDHSRVIFISWLVGEMKMIRDKKFSRDKFFDEMEILFTVMGRKIARGEGIPHWNLIVFGAPDIESEMDEEEHGLLTSKDSELKMKTPTKKKSNDEGIELTLSASSTSLNSKTVLDIIIRSTYDMYAGEVRYALVYAVFVEPIEIQVHNLPFTFRKPRPTKLADSTEIGNFNIRLRKALQKVEQPGGRRSATVKSKLPSLKIDTTKEYPVEPPNSLLEENLLSIKRSFLLPLIESKEAADTFDLFHEAA